MNLLRFGVFAVSISHIVKLFIKTPVSAFALNFVNDPFTIATRMPFTKGLYAAASSYEGYRNAYIGGIMTSSNIMRCFFFVLLYLLVQNNTDQQAMQILFVLAAVMVWGTLLSRFKALNK